MHKKIKFLPSGDSGLILEVSNEISKDANRKIRALSYWIEENNFEEIIEIIPTYTTVLVNYDPLKITYSQLATKLKDIGKYIDKIKLPPPEVIHVPVLYGGDYGLDLNYVAKHNGLTGDEVIDIHSSPNYLVYMIGFTPGFPYLGGMSKKIATPRLKVPREKIPGSSVGIAGNQTGIYPIDSPGGWQIIGRTPLKLFDPNRSPTVLLNAGQYIKFHPISKKEYEVISQEIKDNRYEIFKTALREEK